MAFLFGFLLMVATVGVLVYLLLVHRQVPGAVEQRFGVLEPLPRNVGTWLVDDESDEARTAASRGLKREERLFYDPNGGPFGREKVVRQVRYRSRTTNAIVRVEPDVPVRRRRLKV